MSHPRFLPMPTRALPIVGMALPALLAATASMALSPAILAQEAGTATPVDPMTGQPIAPPTSPDEAGMETQPVEAGTPSGHSPDDLIELSSFTEAVELTTLVDFVATELQINVSIKGDLQGRITFNAPVPVQRKELLDLLAALLDQYGWTITQDRFGLYTVQQSSEVRPQLTGDKPTTRIIPTPNIRPSVLQSAIEQQLNRGSAAAQGGGSAGQFTYIDELGVIVATDSPRRLDAVQELVSQLIAEFNRARFIRLDLKHISAPVARERALQLVGQIAQPTGDASNPNFNAAAMAAAAAGGAAQGPRGALNNLGDRLTVDPQGNALIFRGLPVEIENVQTILAIIDVPNELVPKNYFAGSAAQQIADIARSQGLGEVISISAESANTAALRFQFGGDPNQQQRRSGSISVGGPVMVVDESRGAIVYYGTPQQQARLDALIKELDTKSERVVIEVYKLRNSNSEDVATVIQNLISSTLPQGESSLLPDRRATQPNQPVIINPFAGFEGQAGGTGLTLDSSGFVLADKANNQILVKARAGQQPEFARLIERLDLRRPQVYIQAQIVAVTADDSTRLAFESQLINAGGSGGVFRSNFGLSAPGTGGTQPILNVPVVNAGLTGFTAAVIRSDQVPVIMTALANETDSRVISTPQLLVDDNEEGEVLSKQEIPTTQISRGTGGTGDVVTVGTPATAETRLTVTPQISDSSYLRLEYDILLENFTGESRNVGGTEIPPPKLSNQLKAGSVTVPSDSTVVVGGLVVDSNSRTVAKIPLLGDIPIVGALFRDDRKGKRNTVLYVFLTPRILRDPGFEDLRLLTRGPQGDVKLPDDMPRLAPTSIDALPVLPSGPSTPAPAPSETPPATTSPTALAPATSSSRPVRRAGGTVPGPGSRR